MKDGAYTFSVRRWYGIPLLMLSTLFPHWPDCLVRCISCFVSRQGLKFETVIEEGTQA